MLETLTVKARQALTLELKQPSSLTLWGLECLQGCPTQIGKDLANLQGRGEMDRGCISWRAQDQHVGRVAPLSDVLNWACVCRDACKDLG